MLWSIVCREYNDKGPIIIVRISKPGSKKYTYGNVGGYTDAAVVNVVKTNGLDVELGCRET